MRYAYNFGARYEIIGRVLHGTSVSAYIINDRSTNNKSKIEKGIIEQLALNKQIYNCKGQVYGDIVNLKGIGCKLSELPKYDDDGTLVPEAEKPKKKEPADLKLVGKIHTGRVISDYVVVSLKDPSKQKMRIPKDMVVQLAQDGRILNAKAQMNNGEVILRGAYGVNLAKLAEYR